MPELHLVCGLAGSGKTTLATRLETELPAHRYCPDEWISPLLLDHSDRQEMNRLRAIVEARQWLEAKARLRLGGHVVLENGFWVRQERLDILAEAHALGAQVVLHFLDIPLHCIQSRLEARNRRLPEYTFYIDPTEVVQWSESFQRPQPDEINRYDRVVVHRE